MDNICTYIFRESYLLRLLDYSFTNQAFDNLYGNGSQGKI